LPSSFAKVMVATCCGPGPWQDSQVIPAMDRTGSKWLLVVAAEAWQSKHKRMESKVWALPRHRARSPEPIEHARSENQSLDQRVVAQVAFVKSAFLFVQIGKSKMTVSKYPAKRS